MFIRCFGFLYPRAGPLFYILSSKHFASIKIFSFKSISASKVFTHVWPYIIPAQKMYLHQSILNCKLLLKYSLNSLVYITQHTLHLYLLFYRFLHPPLFASATMILYRPWCGILTFFLRFAYLIGWYVKVPNFLNPSFVYHYKCCFWLRFPYWSIKLNYMVKMLVCWLLNFMLTLNYLFQNLLFLLCVCVAMYIIHEWRLVKEGLYR